MAAKGEAISWLLVVPPENRVPSIYSVGGFTGAIGSKPLDPRALGNLWSLHGDS
jgi:hypothetical protein